MSLQAFSDWLYASPLSQMIQNADWVIPTIQSIHILAISVLFGSALLINLRLVGAMGAMHAPLVMLRRYQPWTWGGLGVVVATGLLMVVGEPERVLLNGVFWWKMSLLVVTVCLGAAVRTAVIVTARQGATAPGLILRLAAGATLMLWLAIIVCGRWIAYAL